MDSDRLKELAGKIMDGAFLSAQERLDCCRIFSALSVPDSVEECEREIGEPHGAPDGWAWYPMLYFAAYFVEYRREEVARRLCRHARIEALMEGKSDD